MRYLSLFSGIEAATVAWHPLGWEPVAFSEIEPFPCALLQHRYPNVPNLGDVTKITEGQIKQLGPIDLVVGGSPCQAFSVAGLRKGLEDPRGNLMLEFMRVVSIASPRWAVWENVPGVLSDSTGAFELLLTGMGELGYHVDTQTLDAQEFGLAQRRNRVFLICEKRKPGPNRTMNISSVDTLENLGKILLLTLGELYALYPNVQKESVLQGVSLAILPKMMQQLGMPSETLSQKDTWLEFWNPSLKNLAEHLRRSVLESKNLDLHYGQKIGLGTPTPEMGEPILALTEKGLCDIEQLLNQALGEVWNVAKLSTTLTWTKQTTDLRTYYFVEIVASIAKCISTLRMSPENLFVEDSLFLTAINESMKYATKKDVKRAIECAYASGMYSSTAQSTPSDIVRYFGDWASRPPILLERESLRGNSPPSRETRQESTRDAAEGTFECGGIGEYKSSSSSSSSPLRRTGADLGNGCEALITRPAVTTQIGDVALTLTARYDSSPCADRGSNVLAVAYRNVAQCLNAGGMGRIDYETETMILAFHHNAQVDQMKFEEHTTAPLTCSQNAAVSLAGNTIGRQPENGGNGNGFDDSGAMYTLTKTDIHGVALPELQVRRLTPKECERLQGFPDLYTLTPFRGKSAADGNRYKAVGNSMAVPVMRYIGEQIDAATRYQDELNDLL